VSELRLAIADVERMANSVSASERRSVFRSDKWDPYLQLALIERERGDVASAFAVSERMRARQMLEIFTRGAVARSATADTVMVARERILRNRIAELTQRLESNGTTTSLRGPGPLGVATDANRESLARAQEDYEQVLLDLDEESDAKPGLRANVNQWRDVAAHLERDQALLEYLVTDSTTLVFIVKHDTAQAVDLGVGQATLASVIDFTRGAIARRSTTAGSNPWRAPLRRLYAMLIGPVEETGLLDDVRTLVIVPHAELHYLPFAALMRERGREQFLVERFDIAYAPSASMWLRLSQKRSLPNSRVLALAPRAGVLPGSRLEVEAIKSIYGPDATVLTGADASERVFRTAGDRYGIVHLATNGILNPRNPLFSFVELTPDADDDGRLEVHEVFGLALHTRLLVLSACQTALASGAASDVPAGDDWVGLVRAFLGGEAEHVIATLWTVEDRSTAQVMERLHRHLHAGEGEIAALSQAQRETLRNSATAGPFYWAGFVIEGGSAHP
jgi:CHAT domain-containing protein